MKRISMMVAFCSLAASPVLGSQWHEGFARGMTTFSASADGGSVVLVCDPDRVFNPDKSNANFVVSMPEDKTASQIVFLASSGVQAAFAVENGISTQIDADPDAWGKLIEMIRAGGSIAVVTARDAFILELDGVPGIECL